MEVVGGGGEGCPRRRRQGSIGWVDWVEFCGARVVAHGLER